MRLRLHTLLLGVIAILAADPVRAVEMQTPIDQANPSLIEQDSRKPDRTDERSADKPTIEGRAAARVDVGQPILVGAIRIEGTSEIPLAAFAPVIDRYLARSLSPDELQSLASDIAAVARARGYGLATAWIPSQTLSNSTVRVVLDEGRIDALRVSGTGAEAVRKRLAPLARGRSVTTQQLERSLLLAGDLDGVRVGRARLERENGRNVLVVTTRRDRVALHAYLDNWGSSIVGPVRARLEADVNGLLASDDQLTVGGMVTPLQPREFQFAQLSYSKPVGDGATDLHVDGYYAHTEAGGELRSYDISGTSRYLGAGLSTVLLRSRSGSLWAYLNFGQLETTQAQKGKRFRHDRETTVTATLYGTTGNDRQRIRARVTFTQGLDLLNATRRGDPLASRRDADGTFSKIDAWTAFDLKLTRQLSLQLQGQAQWASAPLLSSDEMGLGGRYFLRGYDYREFGGDTGAAASAELRYDFKTAPFGLNAFQIYGYADAGRVRNFRGGYGSGSLASAGGGVRARVTNSIDLGLEAGIPLKHGAIPGRRYDPRISFTIGAHF